MNINEHIKKYLNSPLAECEDADLYIAISKCINDISGNKKNNDTKKKLYYISCEFLVGKLLSNNLINLGIYDEVNALLAQNGKSLKKIEELEFEPSLGNGGLGRLAACFLDSVATLGLNGDGMGICYRYGLFKQEFNNNMQTELANPWIDSTQFLNKTDKSYKVKFKDFDINSVLYTMDITGYNGSVRKLNLFDIESNFSKMPQGSIEFDKTDIKNNLTMFLYPDDSTEDGKLMRIYQQYFMVSSSAQYIIEECEKKGCKLYDLYDYAVIQINDTHPSLVIPELIRILCNRGMFIDDAIQTVTKTCAYTNHTILAEALEKWPVDYFKKTIPHILPIIEILDNKVRRKYNDSSLFIIDSENRIHMAHIAIHYSFSTNGVAKLHTDILKNTELKNFYTVYPEKFNNKTNGITFRRWLLKCNPELASFIESLIGDGFKKDASQLENLQKYSGNNEVLNKLTEIKMHNKIKLKSFIESNRNMFIDENSVFDIQAKRLHEYKRQQLNVLYLIDRYLDIKKGILPKVPLTAVFGAKAAPAYTIAKDIIHLILCMEKLILKDGDASKYMKIVMVENYNVTAAEALIPACDISEQISLASKEASGTGNMKFMLNGGITLGTDDGANVEIHRLVGDDAIYIFGDDSDTVIERYKNGTYNAKEYYESNKKIKRAVDFICSKELFEIGCPQCLKRLQNELIGKDWFMTFADFDEYKNAKNQALTDYLNKTEWAEKMLKNISMAGYFSSDRTVSEYNRDIWKL